MTVDGVYARLDAHVMDEESLQLEDAGLVLTRVLKRRRRVAGRDMVNYSDQL